MESEHLSESSRLRLYRACNEWGLFYIKNHGVSKEIYRKLNAVADELLRVPEETRGKLKVGLPWYTPRFKLSPYMETFKFSGPNFSASAAELGFTEQLFGHRATELRSTFRPEMSSESEMCVELPVIDLSESLSESSLESLSAACKEWGFFYITNHGVSKEFYRKFISASDQLFCLPQETKIKVGISSYVPKFVASPFFESFKVSGPDFSASAKALTETLFGHPNTEFSNLLEEYGTKMSKLSKTIIKLLLKTLGHNFETKFYNSDFSNCNGYLRVNNYTPNLNEQEESEGLGKHTDISCVTILFQDDVVGGLQMWSKSKSSWMEIRPREGALVVNIGDLMEAWSNERLRSAEHKVILRRNDVRRFSVAFFWSYGDGDREICAPSEVVGEGNFRIYRPFTTAEYRMFRAKNVREAGYEKVGVTVKDFAKIDLNL